MALGRHLAPGLAALLLLAGCATSGTEYRAGLALHRNPDFSFQVPPGWRPAKESDWVKFGANQRPLQKLNDYGKLQFERKGATEMARYSAVLISSRGSWMDVQISPNQGVKYSRGYVLNNGEKTSLWQRIEREVVAGAPASDKPRLTLDALDVVDFGPNTVLKLRIKREDQRGLTYWTIIGLFGARHVVTVEHCGTPADPNEGIEGLEAIAKSFRFE